MYKVLTVSISERLKRKDNQILTLKTSDSALDSEYKECHNRGVSWEGVAGYPALGHRAEKNKSIYVSLNKKISRSLTTVKELDFHSLELQSQKHSLVPSYLTGNQSLCGIKSLESLSEAQVPVAMGSTDSLSNTLCTCHQGQPWVLGETTIISCCSCFFVS